MKKDREEKTKFSKMLPNKAWPKQLIKTNQVLSVGWSLSIGKI